MAGGPRPKAMPPALLDRGKGRALMDRAIAATMAPRPTDMQQRRHASSFAYEAFSHHQPRSTPHRGRDLYFAAAACPGAAAVYSAHAGSARIHRQRGQDAAGGSTEPAAPRQADSAAAGACAATGSSLTAAATAQAQDIETASTGQAADREANRQQAGGASHSRTPARGLSDAPARSATRGAGTAAAGCGRKGCAAGRHVGNGGGRAGAAARRRHPVA